MFDTLLIANRGEIACRIAATARRMGIRTVAVYSDADADARHVHACDRAVRIGGPEPAASYLLADAILDAARRTGAQAIHPGYGFLSENAGFARACADAGLIFVGPPVDAIAAMGSKSAAKTLMSGADVPLVPGYHGERQEADFLQEQARAIGYPVLIKASAGGGGKGMRIVHADAEFQAALASCQREADSSFGSAQVLIERYLTKPRHIEIQVFADTHGQCVHLFERDCSVQRRHQKVIEEAPAPGMTPERREAMGRAAVAAAQAVGYVGAGTVEFIAEPDGRFYFMEMNTRVQVEHTITEEITGIDIIKAQIRIAAGEPLEFSQEDISYRGFAAQFRINAEDPKNGFLPSFGRISRYYSAGGPGVRTDANMYTGYEIPPYYDSMCAKLIVWAMSWPELIARSRRALSDMAIYGVHTTIPYYQQILASDEFQAADFNTGFVEHNPQLLEYSNKTRPESVATAIAAAIAAQAGL
jgi:acetyl-CoA carboxylase biotin carboxylase subunit